MKPNMKIFDSMKNAIYMLISAAALAAMVAVSCAFTLYRQDKEGHGLAGLWKKYEAAVMADKPAEQVQILDRILKESVSKHLSWDFYDAGGRYVDAVASVNWKDREKAREKIDRMTEQFGDPLVTYLNRYARSWRIDAGEVLGWLEANAYDLKKTYSAELCARVGLGTPDFVLQNVSNDYEYVLLSLRFGKYRSFSKEQRVEFDRMVRKAFDGSYPVGAYIEFTVAAGAGNRKEALEAFAAEYKGRAISLFAREQLLTDRKYDLSEGDTESLAKALKADCEAFEKERSSYRGEEAEIAENCTRVQRIIAELDGKYMSVKVIDNSVAVILRNLDGADVAIMPEKEDKVLWSAALKNDRRSYYAYDTLKVALPLLDDGDYRIVCTNGKMEAKGKYRQYRISLAGRMNGNEIGIYAADYLSGKPVTKADLTLIYKEEELKTVRDFTFDGFTPLPEELVGLIRKNDGWTYIICSYTDADGSVRKSGTLSVRADGNGFVRVEKDVTDATLLLDRSAYNPGDTLQFKAVMYDRKADGDMSVVPEGRKTEVKLLDAKGNKVESMVLKTNDFGSVSGMFYLPDDAERNGRWSVAVSDGEREVVRKWFVLDEFVLPDFVIKYQTNENVYYAGDEVVVRGTVKSWSGHSLSAADVTYSINAVDFSESGTLALENDGSFEIRFVSGKAEDTWYTINVKVTDATGETHEKSAWQFITSSLYLAAELKGEAYGEIDFVNEDIDWNPRLRWSTSIMESDRAELTLSLRNYGFEKPVPGEISWRLKSGNKVLKSGSIGSGETLDIDLSGFASGLYVVESEHTYKDASGKDVRIMNIRRLVKMSRSDRSLDIAGVDHVFRKFSNEEICVQFGTSEGPVWAVAELYDDDGRVLKSENVFLSGKCGEKGSLKTIEYEYLDSYPDNVVLQFFYFKNGEKVEYRTEFARPKQSLKLPFEISFFKDKSYPGGLNEFTVKTLPGVEMAMSAYEKSTETVMPNVWDRVWRSGRAVRHVNISYSTGRIYANGWAQDIDYVEEIMDVEEESIPFQMLESKPSFGNGAVMEDSAVLSSGKNDAYKMATRSDAAAPVPGMAESVVEDMLMEDLGDVSVRDDFRKTLAFFPHLRSDEDGIISFSFKSAEKLSSYYVQFFAHDRNMKTAVERREMTVTQPCKVSVVAPQGLFEGDSYQAKVSVAVSEDAAMKGTLALYVYDTKDYKNAEPLSVMMYPVTVPAKGQIAKEFAVEVPAGISILGLKAVFSGGFVPSGEMAVNAVMISDGMFVTVPVKPAAQVIKEAHSAVLHAGADRDSLVAVLEKAFVNGSHMGAEYKEISLYDMIMEALPAKVEAGNDDVLTLADTYFVSCILESLGQKQDSTALAGKLSAVLGCRNADGGFGWFEGMKSSPLMTAVVLEKLARIGKYSGPDIDREVFAAAVDYLDRCQFGGGEEYWNRLSLEQYVHVRSLYAGYGFGFEPSTEDEKAALKKFLKDVKSYLDPKSDRGMQGAILRKARRVSTLVNLSQAGGPELLKAWGVKLRKAAVSKSMAADIVSLSEYAVAHKDGGIYFPNAVMPFRGLLESELYAHVLLCDIFRKVPDYAAVKGIDSAQAGRISDGICLWMMLQKETQQWDNNPAYIESIASVLSASEEVRNTKVIVLTKNFLKPFGEINASGNGLRITRSYYKVDGDSSAEGCKDEDRIKAGDILNVGDKVVAVYEVWSQENRSFVKVTAPRYGAFRPVEQLSGFIGGWRMRMAFTRDGIRITPQGYRNVKADRTEYYIDVLPEETVKFVEEFYVTQSGTFTSPVPVVESLYSPHYRANDAFGGRQCVK